MQACIVHSCEATNYLVHLALQHRHRAGRVGTICPTAADGHRHAGCTIARCTLVHPDIKAAAARSNAKKKSTCLKNLPLRFRRGGCNKTHTLLLVTLGRTTGSSVCTMAFTCWHDLSVIASLSRKISPSTKNTCISALQCGSAAFLTFPALHDGKQYVIKALFELSVLFEHTSLLLLFRHQSARCAGPAHRRCDGHSRRPVAVCSQ